MRDPLDIVRKCIALSASGHDGEATGEATAAALKACALIREHGFQVISPAVKMGAATRSTAPARPTPVPARPFTWAPPKPHPSYGYADFFGVDFGRGYASGNPFTAPEYPPAERWKPAAEPVKTDDQKRKEDVEEQERVERSKKRMAHEEEVRVAAAKAKLEQEFERARQVMETLSIKMGPAFKMGSYGETADETAENIRKVAEFMRRSHTTGRW